MSYRVKVDVFEGPFDLLLNLVSRQKIDIGTVSITEIADQYLAEIDRMRELDLDVASDFIVVAATLLSLKAAALADSGAAELAADDGTDELSAEEATNLLVERLVAYKTVKGAASMLEDRMREAGRRHPRHAALEPEFAGLMPDFLEGVTLHSLAVTCAALAARREVFLLEASHIASVPISMERHLEGMYETVRRRGEASFFELVGDDAPAEVVVVNLLAVLELYKRGVVTVSQSENFGDIELTLVEGAPEIDDFSVPEWGDPGASAGETADAGGADDAGEAADAGESAGDDVADGADGAADAGGAEAADDGNSEDCEGE